MSEALAERTGQTESQAVSYSGYKHISPDDLSKITPGMLMDKNLEVSKVRPLLWTLFEAHAERFQLFPFDSGKALFSCLGLHQYPEGQLRDLLKQLEKLYETQHGRSMREYEQQFVIDGASARTPDDEIHELPVTLKYAAITGERCDGKE